jgi:CHAT domain-containing protein
MSPATRPPLPWAALRMPTPLASERYRHPFYWAPFVLVGDGE